jgi:hypothetical protein
MTEYITRSQFRKLWNQHCTKTFGLGADDLPDILCMDDYWYEEMTAAEAKSAFADMEMEMRQDLGYEEEDFS